MIRHSFTLASLLARQVYGVVKNWILRLKSRVSQNEQNSASGLRLAITQTKPLFIYERI
jgi:hypothetical protein